MKRRRIASLVGGALSAPIVARAQRSAMPVVGYLSNGSREAFAPQTVKVELVVNMKTARTLGIDVPQSLSGRADEVIE